MILPVGAEGIVLALGFQFSLEKILELGNGWSSKLPPS